ncbi:MAG: site-2 protease family protein [Candidatus Falkowbacteria bacterium]|nr:site-2 protease family protein [Candidatus Falkowbacteria bacterium]
MVYVFQIVILILSAVIHEYMHGWAADRLGDPTAKNMGRLTLNPLKHLDWFGSFLLPLVMIISRMPFVFGWAKPVPYNPYNLRDKKWGGAKVAAAGPLGNLIFDI